MWRARCSLLVKLRLHGGYSVQKNRWDFFFFPDLDPSALTLSPSEPSSSPSDSSMGSRVGELVEGCEVLLPGTRSASDMAGGKASAGSGRCADMAEDGNEGWVGVFDSSIRSGCVCDRAGDICAVPERGVPGEDMAPLCLPGLAGLTDLKAAAIQRCPLAPLVWAVTRWLVVDEVRGC